MKHRFLLLATAAAVAACQPAPGERETRPPSAPAAAPVADTAPPAGETRPADPGAGIRPGGMGAARAGMTIGQLRAALPAGTTLGAPAPFMVDVAGLPVVRGTDTLFRVLVVSGEPDGETAPVTWVATENPAFRTTEGVGPGTSLDEAVAAYGPATLSYSTSDESREYGSFARFPHPGIRFRVRAGGEDAGLAGVYANEGEYNETTTYVPSARIWLVMVDFSPAPAG